MKSTPELCDSSQGRTDLGVSGVISKSGFRSQWDLRWLLDGKEADLGQS